MAARRQEIYMSDDERLTIIETTLSNISAALIDNKHDMKHHFYMLDKRMDKKFDEIDKKFDRIDEKFEIMDERFDRKFQTLIDRSWSSFLWLMSMMIGLAGLIAHAQHWI